MKKMDIDKAKETAIFIKIFIKGGGEETIGLPADFVLDLTHSITTKGYETLHLSGGKTIEVTGFLVYGKEFNKDKRFIIAGHSEEGKD